MQPVELSDQQVPEVTDMPVTVVLERRPAQLQQWVDHLWEAVGVVAGSFALSAEREALPVVDDDGGTQRFLVGGLRLHLNADECESYYHNMMAPHPRCHVVAHVENDGDRPEPFLVSMSFDEAHAYLEGEDEIYAVDVPPEIYRWTEAYVLTHYVAEKRRKRKRTDWKTNAMERPQ